MKSVKKTIQPLAFACFSLCLLSMASQGGAITKETPALNKADNTQAHQTVGNHLITANLPAGESARGETAIAIASKLSGGSAESQKRLQQAFAKARMDVERYLQDRKFAIGDMGVAYALSFVTLWELASNKPLSEEASLNAGKSVVSLFDDLGTAYTKMGASQKDKAYDFLMHTPIIFQGLMELYEKQGNDKGIAELRLEAATLFKEITQTPHTLIHFSKTGELRMTPAQEPQ